VGQRWQAKESPHRVVAAVQVNELRAGGQTTPIAAGDCASEGHFRMEMQGITRGETKWEDGCRLVKRQRQKTSARGSGRRVRDGILIAREDEEGSSCCLLEIIAIQCQSTPRKQKIGGNHKFVVLFRVLGVEGVELERLILPLGDPRNEDKTDAQLFDRELEGAAASLTTAVV
jgi:hypothetical protein